MNDWPKMTMGLAKPEHELSAQDAVAMRQAIERGQRDSALIRNCLIASRYHGSSAEDTYTLLAYHALRALEDIYERQLQLLNTMPAPQVVTTDSASGVPE